MSCCCSTGPSGIVSGDAPLAESGRAVSTGDRAIRCSSATAALCSLSSFGHVVRVSSNSDRGARFLALEESLLAEVEGDDAALALSVDLRRRGEGAQGVWQASRPDMY